MTYDAVVLDMDGVIVERSPSWVFDNAAETALSEAGIDDPTGREFRMVRMLSGGLADATDHFQEKYGVEFAPLWQRRNELIVVNQRRAIKQEDKTLYPDADAVRSLPGPRGVVSNNQQSAVQMVLDRFGLADAFSTWYGLDSGVEDVGAEKPDTGYMNRALDKLDADHAIYVGDRSSDVAAAHNAGIDAAFVRREFNEADEPDPEPKYDVDTLHELADLLADQPAAD